MRLARASPTGLEDSDKEPECSSESNDEIVPESVCEPVLGLSQEPSPESPCKSVLERNSVTKPAEGPLPVLLHETSSDSAREPVRESTRSAVTQAHSEMSPRPGITRENLLVVLASSPAISSGRGQRLLTIIQILWNTRV
ncbi:hypothetical protein MRX96_024725 [Rhipicephalus microplus]